MTIIGQVWAYFLDFSVSDHFVVGARLRESCLYTFHFFVKHSFG